MPTSAVLCLFKCGEDRATALLGDNARFVVEGVDVEVEAAEPPSGRRELTDWWYRRGEW